MTEFDSPAVARLVARARLPLDVGSVRGELLEALDDPAHTPGDRAHLMVSLAVVSQSERPPHELAALLDQAVALLGKAGDHELLHSALGMSASMHASSGALDACLERCLDVLSMVDGRNRLDPRAAVNFGVALISLGAHELAAEHLERAVEDALSDKEGLARVLLVGGLNLSLAIAGLMIIGQVPITDPAQHRRADRVLVAMDRIKSQTQPGTTQDAFRRAILSHVAQMRGDMDLAVKEWGDVDAFTAHHGDGFIQYFCVVEAPLAVHRGDTTRALELLNRALDDLPSADTILFRRYAALQLRSQLHERAGNLSQSIADLRAANTHLATHHGRVPDALIRQIDRRAHVERSRRDLLDQTTRLAEQALVDELSGVANRRALEIRFEELRRDHEEGAVLLLIDIDRFKDVNDLQGHVIGDVVVGAAGRILRSACRSGDQVFRYGGDEFAVVPEARALSAGLEIAARIQRGFSEEAWSEHGLSQPVTVSIGVAGGRYVDDVLADADAQLFAAKAAGRACTRPAPDDETSGSKIETAALQSEIPS